MTARAEKGVKVLPSIDHDRVKHFILFWKDQPALPQWSARRLVPPLTRLLSSSSLCHRFLVCSFVLIGWLIGHDLTRRLTSVLDGLAPYNTQTQKSASQKGKLGRTSTY